MIKGIYWEQFEENQMTKKDDTWNNHFTYYKLSRFSKSGKLQEDKIVRISTNTDSLYTFGENTDDNNYGYRHKKQWQIDKYNSTYTMIEDKDSVNPRMKWNSVTWDIEEISYSEATSIVDPPEDDE
jgi:hypothetical protein